MQFSLPLIPSQQPVTSDLSQGNMLYNIFLAPGTSGIIPETKNIVIGHFFRTVKILEINTTANVPTKDANATVVT